MIVGRKESFETGAVSMSAGPAGLFDNNAIPKAVDAQDKRFNAIEKSAPVRNALY